ncbi:MULTISPECIES: UbiA family prenyltransferase [Rhizobium]|jgi:4-hydroxybenzoate polyprenyltransferase|uniref:UbiA family prenyltransferase n=1 Tax=Rhizobium TaxID=379 RepID=UPI002896AD28
MNVRLQNIVDIPLAVDLDGTLISTDLLWESVFQLLRANPLYLFLLPIWLLSGKARLKTEIARRVTLDASHLPYREDFVSYLRAERVRGRELILVTAAAEPFAKAVAAHLGLFSAVYHTDETTNLAAHNKAALLSKLYGSQGFDYAGNDRADIAVFQSARNAIVVAPDSTADRYQRTHASMRFDAKYVGIKTYIKMLRVHQWLKNFLVFASPVLAHTVIEPQTFIATTLAMVAFSFSASAIYIINDILDLPLDRQHPTKRNRPFASGSISIPYGLTVSALLLVATAAICSLLPLQFAAVIVLYLVVTTAYSLALKRMLLIDVLCLAGLYALRILGGKAATDLPLSFWLIAFGLFFFLSLALVKRYVELRYATVDVGDRIAGRGYRPEDIHIVAQSGVASAFAAALVLALYIQSPDIRALYSEPWVIWPLVPMVLYINIRIWILAHRKELDDDPVVFIATDWRSQLIIAAGAVLFIAASVL